MRFRFLLGGLVVLLAACGSTSTGSSSSIPGNSIPSSTGSAVPATSIQVTWCKQAIGESKGDLLAQMGDPHGNEAANSPYIKAIGTGVDFAEWDVGQDIFLATFENGLAANLQAYAGTVGPAGASDISCPAFRNNGG